MFYLKNDTKYRILKVDNQHIYWASHYDDFSNLWSNKFEDLEGAELWCVHEYCKAKSVKRLI
jgi:hypothetical protein